MALICSEICTYKDHFLHLYNISDQRELSINASHPVYINASHPVYPFHQISSAVLLFCFRLRFCFGLGCCFRLGSFFPFHTHDFVLSVPLSWYGDFCENSFKPIIMNNLYNDKISSGSQADQGSYVSPEITILEITLEKGFATSSASGTEDWGSITW